MQSPAPGVHGSLSGYPSRLQTQNRNPECPRRVLRSINRFQARGRPRNPVAWFATTNFAPKRCITLHLVPSVLLTANCRNFPSNPEQCTHHVHPECSTSRSFLVFNAPAVLIADRWCLRAVLASGDGFQAVTPASSVQLKRPVSRRAEYPLGERPPRKRIVLRGSAGEIRQTG